MRAVQAHADDGCGGEDLAGRVRAQAADRFETNFEEFRRIRQRDSPKPCRVDGQRTRFALGLR